jgi:putative ABC transport system permease protein
VGVLLLLLACINFTNLATAQSFARLKEIGIRKVVGAQRPQLVWQILSESLLTSFFAAVLAIALTTVCMKPFMRLFDKEFVLATYVDGLTVIGIHCIAVVTGLLAGAYPALFFSSYRPARALKGMVRHGTATGLFRRTLVVAQFAVAITLVVSVVTISHQLAFVEDADLGFRSENVLVISSVPREWNETGVVKARTAKARLLEGVSGVQSVSLSWGSAADGAGNTRALLPVGRDKENVLSMPSSIVDDTFLDTYDLKLMAGRSYSMDRPAEMNGIILNETAAQSFGWNPQEAGGQSLFAWFQAQAGDDNPPERPVIGVIADHHFESLHQPIRPLAYFSVDAEQWYRVLSLRLVSDNISETVDAVRQVWIQVFPDAPFEYYFLDDNLDQAYRTEQQVWRLVGIAAILAFFIAGMGMLGLASISVVQRTKEIGVRKVLGASVPGIVVIFSREFVRLVLLALVVAAPVAYMIMNRWLNGFTYGVDIALESFVVTGVMTLSIVWIAIGYHSIRAARANPVNSLRYE